MDKIKKRFKPMNCPICGEMYFSSPNKFHKDIYEEELKEYLNGEVQCRHCGWIYDLDQFENPDSHEGFNKLSLNEYKKEFEEKIRLNPSYDFLEENKGDPEPHMCPVCGEFEYADILSCDICPICGWEDTGYEEFPDEKPSEYSMSFNESLQQFKEKRKNNKSYMWYEGLDDLSKSDISKRKKNKIEKNIYGKTALHINFDYASGYDNKYLDNGYKKHGIKEGFKTKNDYLKRSVKFVNKIDRKNCVSFIGSKTGSTYKYNLKTNEFAVITKDGLIRAYFKPTTKYAYFKGIKKALKKERKNEKI